MRLVFLLLLLANVAAFGYIRFLESRLGPASQIPLLQIAPEKIKLLKPSAQAAASKDKPAAARQAAAVACLEWGSFGADDAPRAAAALANLALGSKVTQRETSDSFWVYIPPQKTKAEADKKAADVKAMGITDYYVVQDNDAFKFAVSLGMFKSEEAAANYLAQVKLKGVRSAVVGPRGTKMSVFVIRDPGDAAASRIAELKADFPTSTLKAATCGETGATKS